MLLLTGATVLVPDNHWWIMTVNAAAGSSDRGAVLGSYTTTGSRCRCRAGLVASGDGAELAQVRHLAPNRIFRAAMDGGSDASGTIFGGIRSCSSRIAYKIS
jgi:hypothetical protein